MCSWYTVTVCVMDGQTDGDTGSERGLMIAYRMGEQVRDGSCFSSPLSFFQFSELTSNLVFMKRMSCNITTPIALDTDEVLFFVPCSSEKTICSILIDDCYVG